MASLLAARRQHLAATLRFHAYAEAVRLGAAAAARLKCALWQNNPPLLVAIGSTQSQGCLFHPQGQNSPLASSAAGFEFLSVFDPCAQGQETMGVAYREGKSDTPSKRAPSQFNAIWNKSAFVFTSRELRSALERLEGARHAIDMYSKGENVEITLVADVVCMHHKLILKC